MYHSAPFLWVSCNLFIDVARDVEDHCPTGDGMLQGSGMDGPASVTSALPSAAKPSNNGGIVTWGAACPHGPLHAGKICAEQDVWGNAVLSPTREG